jgi:hypothetical protein
MNAEPKVAANQRFIAELNRLFQKPYIRPRTAGLCKTRRQGTRAEAEIPDSLFLSKCNTAANSRHT